MFKNVEFEDFQYDEGSIEDLKKRAFALCDSVIGIEGWGDRAVEVAKMVDSTENPRDVKGAIQLFLKVLLDKSPRGMDWGSVYKALFENVPCTYGGFIPRNQKEIEEVTKECIRDKKRIKVEDNPEADY